jgi:predicted aminopeptidase
VKAFVLVLSFAVSGCWSGDYLAKQGVGQLKLLRARRKIADVIADPTTPAELRRRLKLAEAARQFGIDELGLRGGDGFTRFVDSHGAPIAWNLTAAPKDKLEAHLNRFPIVGVIPYLGFFEEADATREADRLRAEGLDVFIRPVAGYSTLGITSDPIYSSMLDGGDARIVEVTLHEMTHATVYLPGHSEWNESMATLVGIEGASAFFQAHGDAASAAKMEAESRERERDQEVFASFLEPVVNELEALYASPRLTKAQKIARREPIFARAQARFLELFPIPPGHKPGPFTAQPLNNAVLISFLVYHQSTPEHRRQLARLHGNLHALIALYKHAVDDVQEPLQYLAQLK